MARKKLSAADESEYTVIGITTPLKDFRLTYYVNKLLSLELEKGEDFENIFKGKAGFFSFFHFNEEHNFLIYYLLSNKAAEGLLIPKINQADFLLLVHGPVGADTLSRILSTLREIPNVITAFPIPASQIKESEQLFLELELHTIAKS